MTIKNLNNEELEKVAGGIKRSGEYQVYEASELYTILNGEDVSIFSGSYISNYFGYLCDGKVSDRVFDVKSKQGTLTITANDTGSQYQFSTDGTCCVNGTNCNYWFGPKQEINQYI